MTSDQDRWLHDALAPARHLESTDAEVATVAAEATGRRRRRRLSRGGRAVAIVLPALLVGATAAAAATGLLSVGAVIPGGGFDGDERRVVKETVVATGVLEGVGSWRITTFETKEGAPCLKIALLDPRGRRAPGPAASGYCGGVSGFSELALGRRAAAVARGEVLLFGTAPATAHEVMLQTGGRTRVSARTRGDGVGTRRYWALEAPARLSSAHVVWADRRGRPGGTLDVSHRFAGPSAPTVVATGTTPEAGRWRMTAYESERHAAGGDLYSPEGLPCIALHRLGPPEHTSGFCGVQPKTPGFTRAQTRSRIGDSAGELILFGHAPERADAVEVRARGRTISTATLPGPPGVPGRFWLLARPARELADGHVYWVDRDGGARGRPVGLLPP